MALEHIEKRAARIRERREDELDITQQEVADRMHAIWAEEHPDEDPDQTRSQMVSDWERAINDITPIKLELLAKALETTVADLNCGPVADRPAKPDQTPDLSLVQNGDGPTLIHVVDLLEAMRQQLNAAKAERADLRQRLETVESLLRHPPSEEIG